MEQTKKSPATHPKEWLKERFGNTYFFEFFFLRNITYY